MLGVSHHPPHFDHSCMSKRCFGLATFASPLDQAFPSGFTGNRAPCVVMTWLGYAQTPTVPPELFKNKQALPFFFSDDAERLKNMQDMLKPSLITRENQLYSFVFQLLTCEHFSSEKRNPRHAILMIPLNKFHERGSRERISI